MEFPFDEAVAYLFARHRERASTIEFPPAIRPDTMEIGYELQKRADAARPLQQQAGGYKISCLSARSQKVLGLSEPMFSPVPRDMILADGAKIDISRYRELGFECEIAAELEISSEAAARGGVEWRDVRIAALYPAFELIDLRVRERKPSNVPTLIADNLYNVGCVLGPRCARWPEMADRMATLTVDGAEAGKGRVRDIIGDPVTPLKWLVDALKFRGRALTTGMVILTGSLCGEIYVKKGQKIVGSVEGLGEVHAEIV